MDAYIGKTCPYCQFPIKPGEEVHKCRQCGTAHHEDCWRENGGCTTYGCLEAPARPDSAQQLDPGVEAVGTEVTVLPATKPGAEPISPKLADRVVKLALVALLASAVAFIALAVYREKALQEIDRRLRACVPAVLSAYAALSSDGSIEDIPSLIRECDSLISSVEVYARELNRAEDTLESWWPHLPTDRRKLESIRSERGRVQAVLNTLYDVRSQAQERLNQLRQLEEERRRAQDQIIYNLWLYEQRMRQLHPDLYSGEDPLEQENGEPYDSYADPDSGSATEDSSGYLQDSDDEDAASSVPNDR